MVKNERLEIWEEFLKDINPHAKKYFLITDWLRSVTNDFAYEVKFEADWEYEFQVYKKRQQVIKRIIELDTFSSVGRAGE